MVDKKYCIFDMDGTLLDSMPYWQALGSEYLDSLGVPRPHRGLEQMQAMTMIQGAQFFMDRFRLPGPPQAIVDGMQGLMAKHYRDDVPLKPGVAEYLARLAARGTAMCVATATAQHLAAECLERLGVAGRFAFIVSCESLGVSKSRPDVFLEAARRLGCTPGEAAVFEDALYAARTARQAGFYTVGVYDAAAARDWEAMQALCHETVADWREAQ
jgi:HAD superfamily hydrolase (TIGR01509 family)